MTFGKRFWIILLPLLTILVTMGVRAVPSYGEFHIEGDNGYKRIATMPVDIESPLPRGVFVAEGDVQLSLFSPRNYKITADDELLSLAVNGYDISLDSIPRELRSDYRKGFPIDLGKYLVNGRNTVTFRFADNGGRMGVRMQALPSDFRVLSLSLMAALLIGVLLIGFSPAIGLPPAYMILVALALLIRMAYLGVTDFDTRGHDTWEHIEYIKYFVQNWSLPPISFAADGAYFHPPLYYFLAALIFSGASLLTGASDPVLYGFLQVFSLVLSVVFVVFGIKTARLVLHTLYPERDSILQKTAPWLAGLLIAIWPAGIVHSTRIGNDSLLYALFSVTLYYLADWYLRGGRCPFWNAAFFTAMALCVKLNATILIATAFILILLKLVQGRLALSMKNLRHGALATLLVLAGLGFASYPGIVLKMRGDRNELYVDNIDHVSAGLRVGNKLENFLWFDVKTFLTEPFTSPWEDRYGRQYFWNYQGKTGLFGEWSYNPLVCHNSATLLSYLALFMAAVVLYAFWRLHWPEFAKGAPLWISTFFLVAGVAYMRYTFPVNIDFRYMLPVLIPFSILLLHGLVKLELSGKTRVARVGALSVLLFAMTTMVFIYGLYT